MPYVASADRAATKRPSAQPARISAKSMAKARPSEQPTSSASPTSNPRVTPRPRTPPPNTGVMDMEGYVQPPQKPYSPGTPLSISTNPMQGGMSAQMGQPLPTREKQIANEMKMASANRFGAPMDVLMGESGGQVGAGMGGPRFAPSPGLTLPPSNGLGYGTGNFVPPNPSIPPNPAYSAPRFNPELGIGRPIGRDMPRLDGGGLQAPMAPPQSQNIAAQLPPQILQRLQQLLAARQGGGAPMRTPGLPSNQNPWLMGSALGMGQ